MMSKKRPKGNTPFQSLHAVEFGLRICEHSAGDSTTVVTTVCRFCEVFGKEESVVERKHSSLESVKYFKAPFWKEKFSSHNKRMYITKWTEYCELDSGANNSFLDIGSSSGSHETMHEFAGLAISLYVSLSTRISLISSLAT